MFTTTASVYKRCGDDIQKKPVLKWDSRDSLECNWMGSRTLHSFDWRRGEEIRAEEEQGAGPPRRALQYRPQSASTVEGTI